MGFSGDGSAKVPTGADLAWSWNPIDCFIREQQIGTGISVAVDADPAAFLRRATYDLTGLPPTREEASRFLDSIRERGIGKRRLLMSSISC